MKHQDLHCVRRGLAHAGTTTEDVSHANRCGGNPSNPDANRQINSTNANHNTQNKHEYSSASTHTALPKEILFT